MARWQTVCQAHTAILNVAKCFLKGGVWSLGPRAGGIDLPDVISCGKSIKEGKGCHVVVGDVSMTVWVAFSDKAITMCILLLLDDFQSDHQKYLISE